MGIITGFTPAQSEIIKEVCYFQLDSLRRIYYNESLGKVDIIKTIEEHCISIDEFKDEIENSLQKFQQLARNHNSLSNMTQEDLSTFRHILSNIEDKYKEKYPKAVSNLWQKLFLIEGIQTSNLN